MLLNSGENIVILDQVYFSRNGRPIFSGLDLDFPKGKVTAILGPSGTGKTTLLQIISGQLQPDKGQVVFKGHYLTKLNKRKLQNLRRFMSILFQQGALFTDLNVFENVAFLLREHTHLSEDMIRQLVLMKLEAVGLRGAAFLPISALSGGMVRRVALARSIMLDPELMMYDEPFTGQDPINRGILLKLIRELNDVMGMTTILVSHDVEEVTKIADKVYILADGKSIASGTPTEVLQNESPWVQQFVQGLSDGPVPFKYPAKDYLSELEA